MYLLQFANKALERSRGFVEDMTVRVDKFLFPINFMVIDMDE